MPIQYHLSGNETSSSVTVIFSDGNVATVTNSSPQYLQLVQLLLSGIQDEKTILGLALPVLSVGVNLTKLSERVVFDNNQIFFDGDVINNSVARVIVRILQEGGGVSAYSSLVAFLEKLYQNPSIESRDALYDFIEEHDISILPDGDFIAYKGVDKNARSIFSGYGIVDGVVHEKAHLLNNIGSVIEIPRSMVDSDRQNGCSVGLHVGSYDYASGFSRGLLLTVKVNPRDIVSVPSDGTYHKIRTCRYVVLGHTEVKIPTITSNFTADNDWADDRKNAASSTNVNTSWDERVKKADDFYNALSEVVNYGVLPIVSFSYRSPLSGRTSTVEDFEIETVSKRYQTDVLVQGINIDGEYRSYLFTGMSDIIVDGEPYNSETVNESLAETIVTNDLETDKVTAHQTATTVDKWASATFEALQDDTEN